MINRITMPLICILGIQAGYAIAQPTERFIEPSRELALPPSVTKVLPSNVTGLFLWNNQPQVWENMSQFLPIPPGFASPGFLPHIPPEINFATEIKPWLGDWTASVLMPSSGSTLNGELDHRTLTLAPVTDANLLSRFVAQLGQQRSEPPIEQEYQGVKILVWPEKVIPDRETVPPFSLESSESLSQVDSLSPIDPSQQGLSRVKNQIAPRPTLWSDRGKVLKSYGEGTLSQTLGAQTSPEEISPSGSMADSRDTFPEPMPEPITQVIPGLAIAVVPGYVAAAKSAAPIEQWLDSRDRELTLEDNPNFQKTLENPNFGRSLLVGYGKIAELAQSFLNQEIAPSRLPFPLPIPDSAQLQNALEVLGETYSSGEVLVWFQPEGFRSQSRVYYKTPLSTSDMEPMGNDINNQIPAATYLSISGKNLNQLFFGLLTGLLNQPAISEVWQILGNTSENGGLNIQSNQSNQSNLIPWIDDEYAFFLFPTTGGLFPAFDPRLQLGLGIIIKTSDRTAAQKALQNLDQWAVRSSEENITLKEETLNGQQVIQWQVFNPQQQSMVSLFSYSWLDAQTLIVASGLDPLKDLHPKPYLSLNQSFTFTTATSPMPTANNGYFYINFGSLLSLVNNFLDPEQLNNDPMLMLGRSILGNIRSVTLSTSTTTTNTQADFFMVLSPRRQTPLNMQP